MSGISAILPSAALEGLIPPIDQDPEIVKFEHEKLLKAGLLGRKDNPDNRVFLQLLHQLDAKIDIKDLCDALPRHQREFTKLDILNTMANMGFEVRQFDVQAQFIDSRLAPMLFISNNHVYSIFLGKNGDLQLFDGTRECDLTSHPAGHSKGKAFIFYKARPGSEDHIKVDRQASGRSWFYVVFKRLKPVIRPIIATSFCINIVTLFLPLLMMAVYDKVIGAHSLASLPALAAGFAALIISEAVLRHMRTIQFTWLGARLDAMIGNEIFRQLLQLPSQLIERASVSSQLVRLKSFESIRDFFSGPIFMALMDLPYVFLLIGGIALIAGNLALISLVMVAAYMVVLYFFYNNLHVSAYHAAKTNSERQQASLEAFNKAEALRYTGLSRHWHERFHDISGRTAYSTFEYAHRYTVLETFAHSLYVLAGLATLYLGVSKVVAAEITAGALIATMILTWRALAPVSTLCTSLPRIEQLKNVIEQVNRLMSMTVEKDDYASGKIVHKLKGLIEFSYVGLRYSKNADPVFAGLSFRAEPGQMMAITGANGSGKSTVLKLVNGMYRPQAGNIRIDGIDIRQIDPNQLHRHIAYVSQHPEFFEGSIIDNMRLVAPLAERSKIEQMLELTETRSDIAALPNGIDTILSAQTLQTMSGSLAYKLNLARALLCDSPILLLDELPPGLLNGVSGSKIISLISAYRGQKTILMITHRDDVFHQADLGLALRAGKVPLFGRPQKVLRQIHENGENA